MKTVVQLIFYMLAAIFMLALGAALIGVVGVAFTLLTYVGGFVLFLVIAASFVAYCVTDIKEYFTKSDNS